MRRSEAQTLARVLDAAFLATQAEAVISLWADALEQHDLDVGRVVVERFCNNDRGTGRAPSRPELMEALRVESRSRLPLALPDEGGLTFAELKVRYPDIAAKIAAVVAKGRDL